jgi:glycine/serine hydroxymethyltransferase
VLEAAGSVLTNKYAEDTPEEILWWLQVVDIVEQIAIDRAKEIVWLLQMCSHSVHRLILRYIMLV